jgi:hypothetical protein
VFGAQDPVGHMILRCGFTVSIPPRIRQMTKGKSALNGAEALKSYRSVGKCKFTPIDFLLLTEKLRNCSLVLYFVFDFPMLLLQYHAINDVRFGSVPVL